MSTDFLTQLNFS